MLPLDVELELYALKDITRDILVLTLASAAMYYGYTRSANDEKWVERRAASYFTVTMFLWSFLTVLIHSQ